MGSKQLNTAQTLNATSMWMTSFLETKPRGSQKAAVYQKSWMLLLLSPGAAEVLCWLLGKFPRCWCEPQCKCRLGWDPHCSLFYRAHLVPVFSFGENELFKQVANPRGSWLRTVQEKLQKIMGFALPLFHARGVFQYSFGLIPFRQPIHTVGEFLVPFWCICNCLKMPKCSIDVCVNGWI